MEDRLKDEIQIKFSGLKNGMHHFQFSPSLSFFQESGFTDLLDASISVEVVLEKQERMLMIDLQISGHLTQPCDRCNAPLDVPIETEEHLIVKFSHTTDYEGDEVILLADDEHKVDLTHNVYELISLALPMRRVHEPKDCDTDIEKYFSQEDKAKPIDERWSALKDLK